MGTPPDNLPDDAVSGPVRKESSRDGATRPTPPGEAPSGDEAAQPPADADNVAPGEMVEHLQILERLGGGGFGEVFRARDSALERDVAVKFLHQTSPVARELFQREAKSLAKLSKHPNIVEIYHSGVYRNRVYFVMEVVEGNAGELIAAHKDRQPLPLLTALRIAAEAAEALAAAHDKGILHRDIKPDNILLEDGDGCVKVADFGLSHIHDPSSGPGDFTIAGTPHGTVMYMAPEVMTAGQSSAMSDVYSLGVTIYRLLVCRPPFEGQLHEIQQSILLGRARPLGELRPDLPGPIVALVEKAMHVKPELRFQSAGALARALRRQLKAIEQDGVAADEPDAPMRPDVDARPGAGGDAVHASPTKPSPAAARVQTRDDSTRSRRRVLLLSAALTAVFAVALGALATRLLGSDPLDTASATPEGVLDYFATQWVEGDYAGMYAALSKSLQSSKSPAAWTMMLEGETTRYGLPIEYTMDGPLQDTGTMQRWSLTVTYANPVVGSLTKQARLVREADGWRIADSGVTWAFPKRFGSP